MIRDAVSHFIPKGGHRRVLTDKKRAVSAFVGFTDDCGLFVFLVVVLFVVFILVIIVVWVLRRQAHNGDRACVE